MKRLESLPVFLLLLVSIIGLSSCTKEDPNAVPDKYFLFFDLTDINGRNIFAERHFDKNDLEARNVLRTTKNSDFLSLTKGDLVYIGLPTDYQEIPVEFEFKLSEKVSFSLFLEIDGPAGLENIHLQNWKFFLDEKEVANLDFPNDPTLLNRFKEYNKSPKRGLFTLAANADKIVITSFKIH